MGIDKYTTIYDNNNIIVIGFDITEKGKNDIINFMGNLFRNRNKINNQILDNFFEKLTSVDNY